MSEPNSSTYTWLSPLEHVLQRPDTYVGSMVVVEISGTVFRFEGDNVESFHTKAESSPALFKFLDEVVVNAIDNHRRDLDQKHIKINVSSDGVFSVANDGKTIPIEKWEGTERYKPEILFGELMSGENFDDTQKRSAGGRNGVGVKIVNIFSKWFEVEIGNSDSKLLYSQRFESNLSVTKPPKITKFKGAKSYTKISWLPDFARLNMSNAGLSDELTSLLALRAFDATICTRKNVSVFFNDKRIPFKGMKDYIKAMNTEIIARDEICIDNQCVFELCITDKQLCIGFVNGIRCSSGTHVEMVYKRISDVITEIGIKKSKKQTLHIRMPQIRETFGIVVNMLIANPSFASQTKEKLDTSSSKFGFVYAPTPSTIKALEKSSVVDAVMQLAQLQEDRAVQKSVKTDRQTLVHIPKYERPTKKKGNCCLYITEGDSAKALAVAGFSVIGRETNGVFPIRGKLINVRGMTPKTALQNQEIKHLTQILGLDPHKTYDAQAAKALPFHHMVIFTDQDSDGSHIAGLLINWMQNFYASLLKVRPDYIQRFATPVVKARIGRESGEFFSISDFKAWCAGRNPTWVKFYKGLGTSTNAEAKSMFQNLNRHMLTFMYSGDRCAGAISTAFDPTKANERKHIIEGFDSRMNLDFTQKQLTFDEFCKKELPHFWLDDNLRSIPSVMDGFKPSQRKVFYTVLKKQKEIKVAQLAAATAECTAYHHGEQSLVETAVHLAQDWIGTNNIALLRPIGQFGNRHDKRNIHAASRYIFTDVHPIAHSMFPKEDFKILEYAEEDGGVVEPTFYAPVVSMLLVNGTEGIGTGYSTSIPAFNPKDVIRVTREIALNPNASFTDILPYVSKFKGRVEKEVDGFSCTYFGCYTIQESYIRITELPPGKWTDPYIEWVKKNMIGDGENQFVVDVENGCSDENVDIWLKCKKINLNDLDLFKVLKLSTKISMSHMYAFDPHGNLKRYDTWKSILVEHAAVRRDLYDKRLSYLRRQCDHDKTIAENKARYIKEVIEKKLQPEKFKKADLKLELQRLAYYEHNNFDYLLQMTTVCMTIDGIADLIAQANSLRERLKVLMKTTSTQLWIKDLDDLETAYLSYESEHNVSAYRNHGKKKMKL